MAKRKKRGVGKGWWGEPVRHSRAARLGWKRRKRRLAMLRRELKEDSFIFPMDIKYSEPLVSGKSSAKRGKFVNGVDLDNFVKQRLEGVKVEELKDMWGNPQGYEYWFEVAQNGKKYKVRLLVDKTLVGSKYLSFTVYNSKGEAIDSSIYWLEGVRGVKGLKEVGDAATAFLKEALEKGWDVKDVGKLFGAVFSSRRLEYAHGYALGSRDKARESKIVLDPNKTVSWFLWMKDPNKYDLKGIDTPTRLQAAKALQKTKLRWIKTHLQVEYEGKRQEQLFKQILEPKLVKALNDSFTYDELKQLGQIRIQFKRIRRLGVMGTAARLQYKDPIKGKWKEIHEIEISKEYFGKKEALKDPVKITRLAETIVHEMVHALRRAQDRHAFGSVEEAQTVAETIVRTPRGIWNPYLRRNSYPGYYGYLDEPFNSFKHDVELLKGKTTKEIKGKKALKILQEKYDKTKIKELSKKSLR